ncbi:TPR repeat-containing protein [Gammaproteobacteria bacterium]|nr:TPR repeat-containing protein [Gammaproteobacteria bacterium]
MKINLVKINQVKINHIKKNKITIKLSTLLFILCLQPNILSIAAAKPNVNPAINPAIQSTQISAPKPKPHDLKHVLNDDSDRTYKILLAETAALHGDFKTAIESYQSIKNYGDETPLLARILGLAFYNKNEQDFEKEALQWVKTEPNNSAALEVLALIQIKNNKIDAAIDTLNQLIVMLQNENKNGYSFVYSGIKDVIDSDKLVYVFDKLGDMNTKKDGMGQFFAAYIANEDGNTINANKMINKALEFNPISFDFIQLKAELMWQDNKIKEALALLYHYSKSPLQTDFNEVDAALLYAKFLVKNLEYLKAEHILNTVANTNSTNLDLSLMQFMLYLELGNINKAQIAINKIAIFDINKSIVNQANLYKKQGKYQEARQNYLKLDDAPTLLARELIVVETFLAEKNLLAFTEQMGFLRAKYPKSQKDLYLQEVFQLEKYNYYQEAYLLSSLMIQYFPEDGSLINSKALLALKLGRYDEFESLMRLRLKDNPNDVNTLNGLGYVIFEQEKTQLYPEAKIMIEQAYKLMPNSMAIMDSMGWMYYQIGDYPQALDYLEVAYNQMKEPEVIVHYLAALIKNNRKKEADEIFKIVKILYPDNEYTLWYMQNILKIK